MNDTHQIETAMSNLQVTVQLSYGDLKLLEEAKVYGTINPLDKEGKEHSRAMVLDVLEKEKIEIQMVSLRSCHNYEPFIRMIDTLIEKINKLP